MAEGLLSDEEPKLPADTDVSAHKVAEFASPDTRYRAYAAFHSNLDNLIWRNIATLLAAIGLGAAAIGTILEKGIDVSPFTSEGTAAAVCFFIAGGILLILFVLWRMRYHHELVEAELRALEPFGYFHARLDSTQKQLTVFSLEFLCSL